MIAQICFFSSSTRINSWRKSCSLGSGSSRFDIGSQSPPYDSACSNIHADEEEQAQHRHLHLLANWRIDNSRSYHHSDWSDQHLLLVGSSTQQRLLAELHQCAWTNLCVGRKLGQSYWVQVAGFGWPCLPYSIATWVWGHRLPAFSFDWLLRYLLRLLVDGPLHFSDSADYLRLFDLCRPSSNLFDLINHFEKYFASADVFEYRSKALSAIASSERWVHHPLPVSYSEIDQQPLSLLHALYQCRRPHYPFSICQPSFLPFDRNCSRMKMSCRYLRRLQRDVLGLPRHRRASFRHLVIPSFVALESPLRLLSSCLPSLWARLWCRHPGWSCESVAVQVARLIDSLAIHSVFHPCWLVFHSKRPHGPSIWIYRLAFRLGPGSVMRTLSVLYGQQVFRNNQGQCVGFWCSWRRDHPTQTFGAGSCCQQNCSLPRPQLNLLLRIPALHFFEPRHQMTFSEVLSSAYRQILSSMSPWASHTSLKRSLHCFSSLAYQYQ